MTVADTRSPARSAYAFAVPPDRLEPQRSRRPRDWRLDLDPGETAVDRRRLRVRHRPGRRCAASGPDGRRRPGPTARGRHRARLAASCGRHTFTPGNPHFSGHLPTLRPPTDAEPGPRLLHGRAAGRSTCATRGSAGPGRCSSPAGRGSARPRPSSGTTPSGAGCTRCSTRPACAPGCWPALAEPYDESFGFDARGGGPLGNYYIANDYALFRLVEHYVGVTGDLAFLSEPAGEADGARPRRGARLRGRRPPHRGDRGRAGRLRRRTRGGCWSACPTTSTRWPRSTPPTSACSGRYAALLRFLGRRRATPTADARGRPARRRGARPVRRRRPLAGSPHPDGGTTIGHFLDFGLVAAAMADDLTGRPARRDGRVRDRARCWPAPGCGRWPRTTRSRRSPTGPTTAPAGAFGAWPGVTAYGLAKLGRPDLAADVLGRTPSAASGGLWGQAMELVPDPRRTPVRVRVAGRGVARTATSIAGAAIAEAVIAGLFGIEPGYSSLGSAPSRTVAAPGLGTWRT